MRRRCLGKEIRTLPFPSPPPAHTPPCARPFPCSRPRSALLFLPPLAGPRRPRTAAPPPLTPRSLPPSLPEAPCQRAAAAPARAANQRGGDKYANAPPSPSPRVRWGRWGRGAERVKLRPQPGRPSRPACAVGGGGRRASHAAPPSPAPPPPASPGLRQPPCHPVSAALGQRLPGRPGGGGGGNPRRGRGSRSRRRSCRRL